MKRKLRRHVPYCGVPPVSRMSWTVTFPEGSVV